MTAGDLVSALALRRSGEGISTAYADPNYESMNGMFGGWTAAVALRAVCDEVDGDAAPSAITVNFVGKVEPGSDALIRTRRVGGGRSVSYWQSELTVDDVTCAVASTVCTARRDTDGHVEIAMPDAPDPAALELTYPAPGPCGTRTGVRPIVGLPPESNPESTYSACWVRELSGRSVDHAQLAFLADHRAPRSFFWGGGPRPSSTLTISVYFHATEQELAAVGDDEILSEAFGARGAQSTSEEHLRLWSRHGALLATSVQMAWYR
jgi:acyl-CoA thioesterase